MRLISRELGNPARPRSRVGHRRCFAAKECPGNLDLERLITRRESSRWPAIRRRSVACLLPARNAAADLPALSRSVAAVREAVVALDDGSTDATRELCSRRRRLVQALLREPATSRRSSAGTMPRTATACSQPPVSSRPTGSSSLDADERIAADDAAALRQFLATDAIPACAYGLQHFRMWEASATTRAPPGLPGLRVSPGSSASPSSSSISTRSRPTSRMRPGSAPPCDCAISVPGPRSGSSSGWRSTARPTPTTAGRPTSDTSPRGPLASFPSGRPVTPTYPCRPRVPAGALAGWCACFRPATPLETCRAGSSPLGGFADAVVALDDGSTDETRRAARARTARRDACSRNPPRESYAGWDDAGNRNRLLDAAGRSSSADWVISLDADERIDAADAAALARVRRQRGAAGRGVRLPRLPDGRRRRALRHEQTSGSTGCSPLQPGQRLRRAAAALRAGARPAIDRAALRQHDPAHPAPRRHATSERRAGALREVRGGGPRQRARRRDYADLLRGAGWRAARGDRASRGSRCRRPSAPASLDLEDSIPGSALRRRDLARRRGRRIEQVGPCGRRAGSARTPFEVIVAVSGSATARPPSFASGSPR